MGVTGMTPWLVQPTLVRMFVARRMPVAFAVAMIVRVAAHLRYCTRAVVPGYGIRAHSPAGISSAASRQPLLRSLTPRLRESIDAPLGRCEYQSQFRVRTCVERDNRFIGI
jgi:hypothetical protein